MNIVDNSQLFLIFSKDLSNSKLHFPFTSFYLNLETAAIM